MFEPSDNFTDTVNIPWEKIVHEIRYAYLDMGYLDKFFHSGQYLMEQVRNDHNLQNQLLNCDRKILQSLYTKMRSMWVGDRLILSGLRNDEKVLDQRSIELIKNIQWFQTPDSIRLSIKNLNTDEFSMYRHIRRNAAFSITNVGIYDHTVFEVYNAFNTYDVEGFIFALTSDEYGFALELSDEGADHKGVTVLKVYAYDKVGIYADIFSKYSPDIGLEVDAFG